MKTKQNYSIVLEEGHELIAFCEETHNAFVKINEKSSIRIAEFTLDEIAEVYGYEFNADPRNSSDAIGRYAHTDDNLKYFNKVMFESEDHDDADFRLSLTY